MWRNVESAIARGNAALQSMVQPCGGHDHTGVFERRFRHSICSSVADTRRGQAGRLRVTLRRMSQSQEGLHMADRDRNTSGSSGSSQIGSIERPCVCGWEADGTVGILENELVCESGHRRAKPHLVPLIEHSGVGGFVRAERRQQAGQIVWPYAAISGIDRAPPQCARDPDSAIRNCA